ncbi:MAG: MFS transporter, partial [Thermoanaerobaculia bacterium]
MRTILRIYREAYQGLPREIWYLSVVILLNRVGTMVLMFLTLYLTQELGFSLAFAGQVFGAYGFGSLVGAWLGGWFSDRVGMLRIQFFSLLSSGIGFLVLEHLHSGIAILVTIFLVGMAAEAFRPANSSALAAFSPPHLRSRAVALNRMALNLGFGIGPAVGGWLAIRDYDWLFRVDGATCILAAFAVKVLFRHRQPPAKAAGDGAAEPERYPLKDTGYLRFLGLIALISIIFSQGWSTYPVYLKTAYGLDESRLGLLMTMNAVLILLFEMVLTRWAERFQILAVIGVGAFLSGVSMAVLPLGSTAWLAVTSMIIWTGGEMLFAPFAGGWVANRAGERHRGKYMG